MKKIFFENFRNGLSWLLEKKMVLGRKGAKTEIKLVIYLSSVEDLIEKKSEVGSVILTRNTHVLHPYNSENFFYL